MNVLCKITCSWNSKSAISHYWETTILRTCTPTIVYRLQSAYDNTCITYLVGSPSFHHGLDKDAKVTLGNRVLQQVECNSVTCLDAHTISAAHVYYRSHKPYQIGGYMNKSFKNREVWALNQALPVKTQLYAEFRLQIPFLRRCWCLTSCAPWWEWPSTLWDRTSAPCDEGTWRNLETVRRREMSYRYCTHTHRSASHTGAFLANISLMHFHNSLMYFGLSLPLSSLPT